MKTYRRESMHMRSLALASVALAVLNLTGLAFGQSISSGTVTGTVADPTGAVVPGATVQIQNPITGYQQTTTTDPQGTFRLNNVPFNNYRLTAAKMGFNP